MSSRTSGATAAMSKSKQTRHPILSLPFSERAKLPDTPLLTVYLLRLMAAKGTNLCLSADVQTTSQLLHLAEECGGSICILKTHADVISDFGERTIRGLMEIAARKKFLIFEDRKFGDIGNTVQMQYGAGSHRIASWASIINAHIFPGPSIITSLRSAAFSAVSAYNSTITTEITGGNSSRSNGYFEHRNTSSANDDSEEENDTEEEDSEECSEEDSDDNDDDDDDDNNDDTAYGKHPNASHHLHHHSLQSSQFNHRKSSIVSISTTISSSAEYVSSATHNNHGTTRILDERPPLARGLLLLAQMSSADNFFTPAYTKRCVELAREYKDFVLGFIAQESLNSAAGDNFVVMTPGISMPPPVAMSGRSATTPPVSRLQTRSTTSSRHAPQARPATPKSTSSPVNGDGMGQQYNTPRHAILEKGVDIIIVGRSILDADDRGMEAERYRREGWRAILERCGKP